MFFRRRRLKRLAEEMARESANTSMTGSEPWLAHGLSNGDIAVCGSCERDRKVKLVDRSPIMLAVAGEMDDYILVCTECGRLVCNACATAVDSMRPKCDDCGGGAVFPMA